MQIRVQGSAVATADECHVEGGMSTKQTRRGGSWPLGRGSIVGRCDMQTQQAPRSHAWCLVEVNGHVVGERRLVEFWAIKHDIVSK